MQLSDAQYANIRIVAVVLVASSEIFPLRYRLIVMSEEFHFFVDH